MGELLARYENTPVNTKYNFNIPDLILYFILGVLMLYNTIYGSFLHMIFQHPQVCLFPFNNVPGPALSFCSSNIPSRDPPHFSGPFSRPGLQFCYALKQVWRARMVQQVGVYLAYG